MVYDYGRDVLNDGSRVGEFCSYLRILIECVSKTPALDAADLTRVLKGRTGADFDTKTVGLNGGPPNFEGTNWSNNTYPYHEQDDISFEKNAQRVLCAS